MAASKIPVWIKQCLDQYGNCACGRAITKKLVRIIFLQILENEGYPCELEILSDQKRQKCISQRWNIYFDIKKSPIIIG